MVSDATAHVAEQLGGRPSTADRNDADDRHVVVRDHELLTRASTRRRNSSIRALSTPLETVGINVMVTMAVTMVKRDEVAAQMPAVGACRTFTRPSSSGDMLTALSAPT